MTNLQHFVSYINSCPQTIRNLHALNMAINSRDIIELRSKIGQIIRLEKEKGIDCKWWIHLLLVASGEA